MIWIWAAFLLFVLAMLALDLGVFHRHAHVVRMREALGWSAVWIALGLSFSVLIYFGYENHWMGLGRSHGGGVVDQMAVSATNPLGELDGTHATVKYILGYVIEKHLQMIGLIRKPELDEHQKKLVAEKRAEFEAKTKQADAFSKSHFPEGAQLCSKCSTAAVVMMDGCMTCLNCGDSKCG